MNSDPHWEWNIGVQCPTIGSKDLNRLLITSNSKIEGQVHFWAPFVIKVSFLMGQILNSNLSDDDSANKCQIKMFFIMDK